MPLLLQKTFSLSRDCRTTFLYYYVRTMACSLLEIPEEDGSNVLLGKRPVPGVSDARHSTPQSRWGAFLAIYGVGPICKAVVGVEWMSLNPRHVLCMV